MSEEIVAALKEDKYRYCTTMFDYCDLPQDWPGVKAARAMAPGRAVEHVEREVHRDICKRLSSVIVALSKRSFRVEHHLFPLLLALGACSPRHPTERGYGPAEYHEIQRRLARGWNTWNTRSVLSHVLLPEGLALNLAFKQHYWLDEKYLREALIGRAGPGAERVRPGPHAYDGSYTELQIQWEQLDARIESATAGDDLVILVRPGKGPSSPVKLVIEGGLLWNRPGTTSRRGDALRFETSTRSVDVYATAKPVTDPYLPTLTPHLVLGLDQPLGISTGRPRSLGEIREVIASRRNELERKAEPYGDLAEASIAIQAGVAWNTIYEPKEDRVVSTVGRLWNEERGGFCLFGWDNFFLAYVSSLHSRDLAFANVIEHLRGRTDEGFIPNDNQGNGRKSLDRSQPPVGGIMVKEVYNRYPERWFLEWVFDDLLAWNRWWEKKRKNGSLLSWGSHPAPNPFGEPDLVSMVTAKYESGMDDSPMYDGVPFNRGKAVMELHDVGLNSLYIADCQALAEIAAALGRGDEERELLGRAAAFRDALEPLWDDQSAFYLNRRTDTGEKSRRLSPTLFYPLLARVPDRERAPRIIDRHFYNPEEFWGEWVLPSIARNDPSFPRQRYWQGAIWPPLNFLTYLSLRQYGLEGARRDLSEKSLRLFLREWRRKGYVSENYSAITGTGDDPRLSSDNFHSWGTLFGIIAFIEKGVLPASEQPLGRLPP